MEVYTKDGKVLQYNGKCITPKQCSKEMIA